MKTSNRILFITGIVIAVILFVSVLGSRFYLNSVTDSYGKGRFDHPIVKTEDVTEIWNLQKTVETPYWAPLREII